MIVLACFFCGRISYQHLPRGMLDYLREWLAFALPAVLDKSAAKEIQRDRSEAFYRDLYLMCRHEGVITPKNLVAGASEWVSFF